MATQLQLVDTDGPDPSSALLEPTRPTLILVHDANFYQEIERPAPGVASRGVHPGVFAGLVGLYAAMLASFWAAFAHDTGTALVLTMVTVLMIVYFGLIVGGILSADAPAPGERQRSFAAFLKGPVDTLNEVITGRQAVVQMLFLPAAMLALAITIGLLARLG